MSSRQIPQINMSTFLDEAETSLEACKKNVWNWLIKPLTPKQTLIDHGLFEVITFRK